MLKNLKSHWLSTSVVIIGSSSIVLGCIFRRRIIQQLWRWKISSIIKGTHKSVSIFRNVNALDKYATYNYTGLCAVGLDCEWVQKEKRHPVALLQLARSSGYCVLIQLCHFDGNASQSLREFLSNEKILKVGVGIEMDQSYLAKDYGLQVRGCVDLRFLAEVICKKKNIECNLGLKALTERHLGKILSKNKCLSSSNWEVKQLSNSQIKYASEDALVGIQLLLHFVGELYSFNSIWPLFNDDRTEAAISRAINELCIDIVDVRYRQNSNPLSEASGKKSGLVSTNTPMKELRRAYSMRRTPLYHNSQLLAPDNEPLCTCDPQKARWYVEKGLGELISADPLVVRLKFEPAGRPDKEGVDGLFYLQERYNICVVCGKEDSYIRKNIIPHEYRKHFPEILKSHQSHDVVLLCVPCHQRSNIRDNNMRSSLASEFNAPIGFQTDVKVCIDGNLKLVRSAGSALLKSSDKMPKERTQELKNLLMRYYNVEVLTERHLNDAASLNIQIYNEDYVPHGFKVYLAYERIGLIVLEQRWRQWFIDSMKPAFLPDDWSTSHNQQKLKMKMSRLHLEHPVRNDYKIALVGSEGAIDVPYVHNES